MRLPLLLLVGWPALPGVAAELHTWHPGVDRRGAAPTTWTLDLGAPPAAAAGLSARIYGSAERALHQPLKITAQLDHSRTLGLLVTEVSSNGTDLTVSVNGQVFHRREWPIGPARPVQTLYHLALPAGAVQVELAVTRHRTGYVRLGAIHLARSPDDLPRDVPRVAFQDPAPAPTPPPPQGQTTRPGEGFRGIWFTLGQFSDHGDKYSGGLGTYTANHLPMAVHAAEVGRTYFVYGGAPDAETRHLLIMAAYYDHRTGQVARPVIVHDLQGVDDPHDNPSLCLDDQGHLWIFISGRGRARPGLIYRSARPHDLSAFTFIGAREFTYPQPHFIPGQGFFLLFTQYTRGRELYWATSPDGRDWTPPRKLAGAGGHYQVSQWRGNRVCTFFNRHPAGDVDRRTDLYYAQSDDFGRTWTTADGTPLVLPIDRPDHPARVLDLAAENLLQYTLDLNFDRQGNPLLLYLVSRGAEPGPRHDPREWRITRWTGSAWETRPVCRSDHNYDCGSLYVSGDRWRVFGPTQAGPQAGHTGGEMAVWTSQDAGSTWHLERTVTHGSRFNHTYARRPLHAAPPFEVFWADGDPTALSPSRLYFSDQAGEQVHRLPATLVNDFATPESYPQARP
jgi:hypothetical protein